MNSMSGLAASATRAHQAKTFVAQVMKAAQKAATSASDQSEVRRARLSVAAGSLLSGHGSSVRNAE